MQIRAAVLDRMGVAAPYATTRPLAIRTLQLDPPGPDEVLIRVVAAGLCHSDLSVINGDRPRPLPMALGHEAAGIVEEVGSGVRDLQRGDHVVVVFVPSCGHCPPCAEGRPALCEPGAVANGAGTLLSGARRLHADGARDGVRDGVRNAADDATHAEATDDPVIHHHLGCSVFADHAVVSRRSLVRIDPDVPLVEAALFGCAVLTGVGAVVNTAQVRAGASTAIVGLGGVGLAALLGARAAGARTIVAVDLSPAKLDEALALGATHVFDARDPETKDRIRAATQGGVEYAFEFAGATRAFELAYGITRRGGTTVTAGLPPPAASFAIPGVGLVAEERTVKGSYIGTCVPSRDIPRYLDLYRQGRLPVDRLLSGRLALDDINRGFDLLHEGKAVRQVVVFD